MEGDTGRGVSAEMKYVLITVVCIVVCAVVLCGFAAEWNTRFDQLIIRNESGTAINRLSLRPNETLDRRALELVFFSIPSGVVVQAPLPRLGSNTYVVDCELAGDAPRKCTCTLGYVEHRGYSVHEIAVGTSGLKATSRQKKLREMLVPWDW